MFSAIRGTRVTAWPFDAALAGLGLLGLALGGLVLGVIVLRGNTLIEPEGDLTKSLTFNVALGIYYLTLAFYLPQAGFSTAGRRAWLIAAFLFTLYGYSVETVQIFRGIDPRFSEVSSTVDDVLGGLFGLMALGQIIVFGVLAARFFRMPATHLVLAIRYAAAATFVAFAAGIWMSVVQGRAAGEQGNILILHAMGFHALQAIPVLALLLHRSPSDKARGWIHVGGAAWIAACLAVAVHTASGYAPDEPSAALVVTISFLLLFLLIIARAAYIWIKGGTPVINRGGLPVT